MHANLYIYPKMPLAFWEKCLKVDITAKNPEHWA